MAKESRGRGIGKFLGSEFFHTFLDLIELRTHNSVNRTNSNLGSIVFSYSVYTFCHCATYKTM